MDAGMPAMISFLDLKPRYGCDSSFTFKLNLNYMHDNQLAVELLCLPDARYASYIGSTTCYNG